jgi:hypothetical protein
VRADALAPHRASIVWALVTVGGLIIALTAVLGSPTNPDGATRGARLSIGLPDAVAVAVAVLLTLAALLLLALLWPRELWRRRKKGPDEFELYYENPKVSPWVGIVLLMVAFLPLAVTGWLLWHGWSSTSHDTGTLTPPSWPGAGGVVPSPDMQRPSVSMTSFDVAVVVLAIVAGLASVGVMVWLYFGARVARWWAGRLFDDVTRSLREAVVESLDALRAEPDPRVAIIKCYRRFEQALALARLPRAPWETPTEFMRVVLERLALPPDPVTRLTRLFELSRFSDRRLGTTERDVACDCLEEIRAALEGKHDAAEAA